MLPNQTRKYEVLLITEVQLEGGGAREGPEPPPQNLADQLTLLEPWWADFAPHTTVNLPPPRIQKAIYTSVFDKGGCFK